MKNQNELFYAIIFATLCAGCGSFKHLDDQYFEDLLPYVDGSEEVFFETIYDRMDYYDDIHPTEITTCLPHGKVAGFIDFSDCIVKIYVSGDYIFRFKKDSARHIKIYHQDYDKSRILDAYAIHRSTVMDSMQANFGLDPTLDKCNLIEEEHLIKNGKLVKYTKNLIMDIEGRIYPCRVSHTKIRDYRSVDLFAHNNYLNPYFEAQKILINLKKEMYRLHLFDWCYTKKLVSNRD